MIVFRGMRFYIALFALALVCAASPSRAQSENAELYRDIGNTLMRRGRPADAAKSYGEALRLRPDLHDARRGLGMAYMKMNRHEEAERVFRRLVESRPEDAGARYYLGVALYARGAHEEALAAYREALRIQPSHAEARLAIVMALGDLGRSAEALAALSETPRAGEPRSVSLGRRARAAHAAGRHGEAVLFWTQALEHDAKYFDTRQAERLLWDESVTALTAASPASSRATSP
jgi:tetratricopeptide (TPR) repeat protein